jgi:sugar lactone lactonase YvrE
MRSSICVWAAVLLLAGAVPSASAQSTSNTWSLDDRGMITKTQNAYLPDLSLTDLGLSNPSDIFIDLHNRMYIADTGHARIALYDITAGAPAGEIKLPGFITPQGVFVTGAGDIYVADSAAASVFRLNAEGELTETFTRPDAPAFADTAYRPMKVCADNRGSLYIISEGVSNGVIQLSNSGEFLGYFATNKTALTLEMMFQDLIFSRFQKESLSDRAPVTFSNVCIDRDGIIYTTTSGTYTDGVKKHNTAGGRMFDGARMPGNGASDVWAEPNGIIFVADLRGFISAYTADGQLIFYFGDGEGEMDIAGVFAALTGIALDTDGRIWGLDGRKGYVQSFVPTDYALKIYGALKLFDDGLYAQAGAEWSAILQLNQMSTIAHNGIGRAYMSMQRYEEALAHFRVAGNRSGYSDAFWEIRNKLIQREAGRAAAALAILGAAVSVYRRRFRKRRSAAGKPGGKFRAFFRAAPVAHLTCLAAAAVHPIDTFYLIRRKERGSVPAATAGYFAAFAMFLTYTAGRGFIYRTQAYADIDFGALITGFFILIGLFVLANTLVAAIREGDGGPVMIYKAGAYSLFPLTAALGAVTLLSHVLTFNEAFLLDFILLSGGVWTAACLFLGLKEIHDYTVREVVKSLLFTAAVIGVILMTAILILVMSDETFQFLEALGKEFMRNVTRR